jgi:hypothetical protein
MLEPPKSKSASWISAIQHGLPAFFGKNALRENNCTAGANRLPVVGFHGAKKLVRQPQQPLCRVADQA